MDECGSRRFTRFHIRWATTRERLQMYISLKDSYAKGFRKWADAHQPEIRNDLRASGENRKAAASPDQDNLVVTLPEQPHRPWLVPGAGTL
jgi:hypothetical protein